MKKLGAGRTNVVYTCLFPLGLVFLDTKHITTRVRSVYALICDEKADMKVETQTDYVDTVQSVDRLYSTQRHLGSVRSPVLCATSVFSMSLG
jgi:hypothetical protein